MSIPRAATSVATSTRVLPCEKEASAASRSACGLSPCIASAATPSANNDSANSRHPRLVLTNTITRPAPAPPLPNPCALSAARNLAGFPACETISTSCVMVLTACKAPASLPCPTRTSVASRESSAASACTCTGHVAVKKSVWRSLGSFSKAARICGSKPMSSIRSASSSTTSEVFFKIQACLLSSSSRRPGVATSSSTPSAILSKSSKTSVPP
mmetsp:Transcript_8601/g.21946  ORF Transcript_8601/g.21946 Transcript_8601/m.21946 type:complete len:214 (+) Transcript_8601:422-1063(+)